MPASARTLYAAIGAYVATVLPTHSTIAPVLLQQKNLTLPRPLHQTIASAPSSPCMRRKPILRAFTRHRPAKDRSSHGLRLRGPPSYTLLSSCHRCPHRHHGRHLERKYITPTIHGKTFFPKRMEKNALTVSWQPGWDNPNVAAAARCFSSRPLVALAGISQWLDDQVLPSNIP